MKTNFKNIFNEWEDDLMDIPENTFLKDTVVSSDSVKSRVFSELGINKKKKPFGKTFKMTFIAAALITVTVIGTTAFAQGQFKYLFGGYVNGDENTPVGIGENQTFSGDKVNVQLMGITGDNTKLYSVLSITKKDGSDFVDDYQNNYVLNYDEEFKSDPKMDEMFTGDTKTYYLAPEYEFEDNKTIKAKIDIPGNINGKNITVKNHELFFYHIDKILYQFNGNETFEQSEKIDRDIKNNYSQNLKDNQFIKYDADKRVYYMVTKNKSEFSYEISFDVKYDETPSRDFDIPQNTVLDFGKIKLNVQAIHSEKTGFTITGTYQSSTKSAVMVDDIMSKQLLTVTMEDGSIIKPGYRSLVFDDKSYKMEIYYEFTGDDGNVMLIDTDNIKSVSFGNITFS